MRLVHFRFCSLVANEQRRRSRTSVHALRLILLLCVSCPALTFGGERYDFRYFEGRNGHRIVEARDMAETSDGAVWVATWGDGVHRIHNTDYKHYTSPNDLTTNWFRSIEHVGGDTLWAPTRDGLIPITRGRAKKTQTKDTSQYPDHDFRVMHSLSDGRVLAVTSEGDTLLFAARNGGVLAKEWSIIATRESFQDSAPTGFVELPTGDILAAIKKGGLYRFDGTEWMPDWGEGSRWLLHRTEYDDETTIWAAQKGGRDIFRWENDDWKQVASAPEGIICFLPLAEDGFLVGSARGVHRFSNGEWEAFKFRHSIGTPAVFSMLQGTNGILWIGTLEGLIRGVPQSWQGNFKTDDGVELVSLIRTPDHASPLWFVDAKNRLVRFEDARLHPFLELQTTDKFELGVFSFAGEDSVWGLSESKMQKYSLRDGSLEQDWPFDGGGINLCKTTDAGHVLLTSYGAYTRRDNQWVEFPEISGYKRKGVFDLVELDNGALLAGVEDDAELWKDGAVEHLEKTEHDFHSIHATPKGRIWIGGLGQGVMEFDGAAAVPVDSSNTTNSQLVTNIYEARDGTLWASLRRGGIASLRDGRWVTHGYVRGLPNKDIDCIREDDQGRIWVSVSTGGVYSFQPDKSPPDTQIFNSSNDVASHGIASFSFSGWDAWGQTPRRNLVYSWRVVTEPDGDIVIPWSDENGSTMGVTSALDPGGYRLEVRAADQDRNVDPTPASYSFRVQFPIWQQPAYMMPLVGLVLAATSAFFLWYSSRTRRQRAEFERSHLEHYAEDLEVAVAARAAESLESAATTRAVLEAIPDMMFRLSREGKHLDFYSSSNEELFADQTEIVGKTLAELLPSEVASEFLDRIEQSLERGKIEIFQYVLDSQSGDSRFFEARMVPFGLDSVLVLVSNITDRKRAEEEARKNRDELAHVSRISTMGEMATGVAHELNQPLAAIASYSYAAGLIVERSDGNPQELQDVLGKLEKQAVRAGDIVRRLRNFVKKSDATRVLADLNELVRDVAKFVEPDIRQAETTLVLQTDEPAASVVVDEIQVQQVLVNLIRNAIDSMQDMSADQREVVVSTRILGDGQTEIAVRDCGKGLTEDELEQAFNAFFSTKQEGMGMGLPISRSIVESHGGKLWAEPNTGPGVTFGFTIPPQNGHDG